MKRRAAGLGAACAALVIASAVAPSVAGADVSPGQDRAAPVPSAATLKAPCTAGKLKTVQKGTLTLGADDPLYEPWYADNNPGNGKGFEDAVAYAVAGELGYQKSAVHWVRVTFNAAIAPGPKSFDYDLDEFSISAQRRQAVDFSTPYYTVHEAIVGLKGTPAAKAHTLAAVRKLQLGAQVGSTDYETIVDQIHPAKSPRVYNSNSDAIQALEDGQIQGLVVDLPTAFEITSGEAKGSVIVGQLPSVPGHPEQFGILLDKGSPLTGCVDKAVTAITKSGVLAKLTTKWLAQAGSAPVLK
jgi:polar amino acid transport system substrate-binding protein